MNTGIWGVTRKPSRWLVVPLVGVFLLAGAETHAAPVKWDNLSSREKTVLKSYQSGWSRFSEKKQKVLRRWANLSSSERSRIRSRHKTWKSLSASRQAKIIKQLKRYKQMSPAKRARINAWRKWVKRLPSAEQKKLHRKWGSMSDSERKAYIQQLEKKYGRR